MNEEQITISGRSNSINAYSLRITKLIRYCKATGKTPVVLIGKGAQSFEVFLNIKECVHHMKLLIKECGGDTAILDKLVIKRA